MKTTIIGVLTIVSSVCFAALAFLKTGTFDLGAFITGVTAGFGLIKAADSK
jgi:hypothetical protein